MAKKDKKLSPYQKKKLEELEASKKNKPYKNPTKSLAGKIIIFILALLMLGSGLFALIYAIVNNIK